MNEIKVINKSMLLGKEIDVYGTADEPLFKAKDVASWLDIQNVSDMIKNIDQDEKVLDSIYTLGGTQEVWLLTEDGVYEVLMQSRKPVAKQFKKGVKTILKSIRKTGGYSVAGTITDKTKAGMIWVKGCKELLNLNDASTLALMQKVAEPLGLPTPDYVSSKGVLKSLSVLLEEKGIGISTQAFNKLLVKDGLLQVLYRKSSKGKQKQFKNITEKGLPYGENKQNPKNQSETQPLWYDDKFDEVLKIVGLL